jgi:Putative threonine efflux protein
MDLGTRPTSGRFGSLVAPRLSTYAPSMLGNLLAFTGVALLLAMVPGPSFALVLRQTVRGGRRLAFMTTLGNATGVTFWATSAVLGLSVLVAASTLAYNLMQLGGALALVALGARSVWRSRHPAELVDPAEPVRSEPPGRPGRAALAGYRTGVLISFANPKPAVFAMTVLPRFVSPSAPDQVVRFLLLVAAWVLVSSAWYVVLSWTMSRVQTVFGRLSVRRRVEQISGVVLIAFGVRLAAQVR